MLQLRSDENVLLNGVPSVTAIQAAYRNRDIAVSFVGIDSTGLALGTSYDVVFRQGTAPGGKLSDSDAAAVQDLPDCRIQFKPGLNEAQALAAIDACRAIVDASWPA